MSSEWGDKCAELNTAAAQSGVDSVFPVFGEKGGSQRWHFFSVFTNHIDNWCRFGRTRVTFDAVSGQWNCPCRGTGRSHRCIHRMMGMWWIFQELPGTLLASSDIQLHDIDDLESQMQESTTTCHSENLNTQKICVLTEHLTKHKRIPSPEKLSLKLRTEEDKPTSCFVPSENTCPYCPGPTPPELNPSQIVTTQAVVYGMKYVQKG